MIWKLIGPAPRQRRTDDRLLELHDQAQKVIRDIDETLLMRRIRLHRTEQRSAAAAPAQQQRVPIEYHCAGYVLEVR